jgi:hypothetical protein
VVTPVYAPTPSAYGTGPAADYARNANALRAPGVVGQAAPAVTTTKAIYGERKSVLEMVREAHHQAIAAETSPAGSGSLASVTTGLANTGIGTGTLAAVTTGTGNTAAGQNALASNDIGTFNTADGFFPLRFKQYVRASTIRRSV